MYTRHFVLPYIQDKEYKQKPLRNLLPSVLSAFPSNTIQGRMCTYSSYQVYKLPNLFKCQEQGICITNFGAIVYFKMGQGSTMILWYTRIHTF